MRLNQTLARRALVVLALPLTLVACSTEAEGEGTALPEQQVAAAAPEASAGGVEEGGEGAPRPGKYTCTESVRQSDGTFEYQMLGSVTLERGGRYSYVMGAPGKWNYVAERGVTTFTGGYLDGAEGEGVEGEPDRLRIVRWPAEGRGRWMCRMAE